MSNEDKIKKVSIIVSRGSLEGIYPGLIMANGARMEGIEANLFFTFFGLYGVLTKYMNDIKVATVGNPAMRVPDAKGFPLPTWMGALPGMSAFATMMMKKEMDKLDIPPVGEFIEMIHDAGGKLYACKATVDMFHLTEADFCPQMEGVMTVGEFYEMSAGAQIIFT
ncbi:MAG: DsrE/DsrF/DrsH-like family protein [Verrucomicrobiales bacterium]|nr:DsrE/DsrF/DrsH-like family protein [Verrucomicrobiota bacterium JB025]